METLLLSITQVRTRIGVGKNRFFRSIRHDPNFPKQVALPGQHPRWRARDIDAYIDSLPSVEVYKPKSPGRRPKKAVAEARP